MSEAGTILEAYKEAVVAQKEKRYLKAARFYRIANLARCSRLGKRYW